jgi:outer membrane receptor protein involved in Fe transport
MNQFPRSILGAAIAAVLATPAIVWAQSADAALRGKAPANTAVTAKNVATGATRRTQANAEGYYTLSGLSPGTYRVDAGPGTETTVTVSVASTATLDLIASSGAVEAPDAPMQEITVEGKRLSEVRTSEVGGTVSEHQIETVPQITRNFLEFADTVPGVVFEVDGSGRTKISGGAQNKNGVNLYIDGVGQKGYVRSGVSGQAGDTQGNPFPQLAIGEYKVITSNYKAEYDQISSAAITALSRSGTNEFSGEAFGTYTADNYRASTPAELDSDQKAESESKEYGIAFGGPIIQDRLHFFLTYEGKRFVTPVSVLAAVAPADVAAQMPPSALAQLGPTSIDFEEDLFFAKLDWALSDRDSMQLSAKIRDEVSSGDRTGVGIARSATVDTSNDDTRLEFNWKHNADTWLNEVQLTYEDAFYVPQITNADANGAVYTWFDGGRDNNVLAVDGADPRAGQNKGQKGWAIGDTITFSDVSWGSGVHNFKAGVKYKDVDLTAADSIPGNPVFYYDVTAAGTAAIPWKSAFALPLAGFDSEVTTNDKQLGVFVQDDWTVNDHLTLNLGVRWDKEQNESYLDFVTPQFLLDSLNTEVSPGVTYGQSLGLSADPNVGIDINDYISTGNNRKARDDAFQPRFGFSYDIGGDQAHVIFGGAGRAYDRTLYDYLQLEQTKFALATAEVRFNTVEHPCTVNGSNCVNWDPAFATPGALTALLNGMAGEVDLINNDLAVPYSDQFSLGMRNRLGDWNTSVAVTRIESKDGFVFTLGNRYPNGDFWQNRSQPWGNSPPGLAGVLLVGDTGIETESTQVLLSAEKPFTPDSRWGATFSYTFTDAEHNRDINEHYLFDESSVNAFPFITSNAAAEHRVVATGSFAAPWGFMLAGKLTWSSPIPRNVISCYAGTATFPTGAPCNPFAVTANDTAGYQSLDLQITKNFELGDMGSMYIRIDALNVTNEHNLVDYIDTSGPDGIITSTRYAPFGNITGVPRTVRMSLGVKF